jgi:hypothetical protein
MSKHMLLSACVRATLLKEKVRDRLAKGLVAIAAASPVVASADDIAGMLSSAATGSSSATKSVLTIAQFVGVVFVCGGVIAAKTKKDNPQIKVSHIVGAIVFGVCLIAIPELIKRSQTQVGLTPINVG